MQKKGNLSSLQDHIKTTSKKVESWSSWKKKIVEQRVLLNSQTFTKS
jgi:hypothetical protein